MFIYGEKLLDQVENKYIPEDRTIKWQYIKITALLLGIVIALLYFFDRKDTTSPTDIKITQQLLLIDKMKREASQQQRKILYLTEARDSAILLLSNKVFKDREVINSKYEKERNDILVLSDDESVGLLSKNLRGK